jgi:hypothetical protein
VTSGSKRQASRYEWHPAVRGRLPDRSDIHQQEAAIQIFFTSSSKRQASRYVTSSSKREASRYVTSSSKRQASRYEWHPAVRGMLPDMSEASGRNRLLGIKDRPD